MNHPALPLIPKLVRLDYFPLRLPSLAKIASRSWRARCCQSFSNHGIHVRTRSVMDNSGPAVLRSNLSPGSAKWAAPWGLGGYRHKRLDTSALTIRLLKLHRSHSNNIEGYLRQFTLDDAPEYTALSYTWGKKTDQKQICIEGRNFEVWPNLYNFLELFMSRGSDEWLWVDQVSLQGFTVRPS